jgi:hypothetical protein
MMKRLLSILTLAIFAFAVSAPAMSAPVRYKIVFHNNNSSLHFRVNLEGARGQDPLPPRSERVLYFLLDYGHKEIGYTLENGSYSAHYGLTPSQETVDVYVDSRGYNREPDVPNMHGATNRYYGKTIH